MEATNPCFAALLLIADLAGRVARGKFLNIGFGTDDEVATWDKMPLPDTKLLRLKVDELEARGHRTNFTFE